MEPAPSQDEFPPPTGVFVLTPRPAPLASKDTSNMHLVRQPGAWLIRYPSYHPFDKALLEAVVLREAMTGVLLDPDAVEAARLMQYGPPPEVRGAPSRQEDAGDAA